MDEQEEERNLVNEALRQEEGYRQQVGDRDWNDIEAERDSLKLQISEAMKACTVSGHDKNHTEPRHCIAALDLILQSRQSNDPCPHTSSTRYEGCGGRWYELCDGCEAITGRGKPNEQQQKYNPHHDDFMPCDCH